MSRNVEGPRFSIFKNSSIDPKSVTVGVVSTTGIGALAFLAKDLFFNKDRDAINAYIKYLKAIKMSKITVSTYEVSRIEDGNSWDFDNGNVKKTFGLIESKGLDADTKNTELVDKLRWLLQVGKDNVGRALPSGCHTGFDHIDIIVKKESNKKVIKFKLYANEEDSDAPEGFDGEFTKETFKQRVNELKGRAKEGKEKLKMIKKISEYVLGVVENKYINEVLDAAYKENSFGSFEEKEEKEDEDDNEKKEESEE
ncbi:MAG: hypothetical protein J6P21_01095 [Clostridia bacterium]|nr:hypothetical protein [Clostridia bacterium]